MPGMTRAELINFLQDADSKSNGVFQIYEKNLEAFDYICSHGPFARKSRGGNVVHILARCVDT